MPKRHNPVHTGVTPAGLGRRLVASAIIPALALLAGCNKTIDTPVGDVNTGQLVGGATVQMTNVQPVGGFLPDPSLLQPGTAGQAALVYLSPNMPDYANSRIMLDPVVIYTAPGSGLSSVPLDQRQAAANTFTADLTAAMAAHCQMTRRPGRNTLHIKVALVDTTLPNAAVNTAATYIPYVSGAYSLASYAMNGKVGYFAGTATAESYATDSKGAIAWQVVDKRGGTTAAVENTLDTWLDVHHAFQAWAAMYVSRMQQLGVCSG